MLIGIIIVGTTSKYCSVIHQLSQLLCYLRLTASIVSPFTPDLNGGVLSLYGCSFGNEVVWAVWLYENDKSMFDGGGVAWKMGVW